MTISPALSKADQTRLAKIELVLRKARRNLTTYKRLIWRRYDHAPHLDLLDRALEQCSLHAATGGTQGIGFLIVEMPPRHGKSLTISKFYPTWHLGNYPDHRIILSGYGATLAHKSSRYARNVLLTPRYQSVFPSVQLAPDSAAADAWNLAAPHEGGLDAMGVGGGVTGKGGHIIIVDDPIKSREEAESETYREKVFTWFTDDLYTRREPGAALIVVMTRWHQDDLVGRLLTQDATKWHRLRLPALAEPGDVLGREPGAALWPARYDGVALADIERTIGEYSFAALFQQNPVPSQGGTFKREWLPTVPAQHVAEIVRAVRFWDLAMSEKTGADYTVGVKLGWGKDGRIYVLDVARVRLEWGEVVPYIAQVALMDGPQIAIGIEEKGYMSRAVQELTADPRLHQYAVWGYAVDKDKLTRALPFAARCAAGNVSIVEGHWTRDYMDELCAFPKGAHDDQVDSTSGAWAMLGNDNDALMGGMNYADEYRISSEY